MLRPVTPSSAAAPAPATPPPRAVRAVRPGVHPHCFCAGLALFAKLQLKGAHYVGPLIYHPRKLVSLLQRVVLVRKIGGLSNRDNNVPVPRNSPFRDGSGPFALSRATSRLTRKSGSVPPCARLSRTDRARPLSQALPLPSEFLLPDNG